MTSFGRVCREPTTSSSYRTPGGGCRPEKQEGVKLFSCETSGHFSSLSPRFKCHPYEGWGFLSYRLIYVSGRRAE